MKTLYIYPAIPDTFWSFRHALSFMGEKAAFPPLGLLTIAAMSPKTWEKRLVDMNTTALTDDDIRWADMVFTTAMHVQRESVTEVTARCRRLNKTIVAGGPYFTTAEEDFSAIDHRFQGEAEETFPTFLADLERGTPRRLYAAASRPDLSLSPIPAWELINMQDYDSMLVQFSRGCPFDCEFCNITQLGGSRPRTKPPAQFIAEIDALYRRGWYGSVFVVDDNFIGNKAKVKELLKALELWMDTHGRPFHFFTEASINLAEDRELIELMTRAGFNKVFIGIETPNEASLKEAGKTNNLRGNLLQAVQTIHAGGLEVMGGFILGFDHDTPDIFERQIAFIQQSGIIMAMVGLLDALPGTRLYQRLQKEGRLREQTSGDNTDGTMNFIPRMEPQTLQEGYQRVLEGIYAPKAYYERCITFL
ncbi:MAG TPA: B12-binding domain-containing radical SAM protein, partial [Deltaproteobacteria bacterium]|nr:B12-binding domain-containing radical SAM protein [Deltaproteobacteria bacterium]